MLIDFNNNGVDGLLSDYLPTGVSEDDFIGFVTGQDVSLFSTGLVVVGSGEIFVGLYLKERIDREIYGRLYDFRIRLSIVDVEKWLNRHRNLDILC